MRMLSMIFVLAGIAIASSSSSDPAFHKELKQFAAEYKKWGRVDDEARWAPELCRMPLPPKTYVSKSEDETTHGRKLYSLFAKDRNSFLKLSEQKSVSAGQVIVKQSWIPEEIEGDAAETARKQFHLDTTRWVRVSGQVKPMGSRTEHDHFAPYALKDDKVFKGTKQADLFLMYKVDAATPDTDQGWVYGTVTPDGKTVTSAGKVQSCMACHAEAKVDRLFGLASK